jgi:hypothetical protein
LTSAKPILPQHFLFKTKIKSSKDDFDEDRDKVQLKEFALINPKLEAKEVFQAIQTAIASEAIALKNANESYQPVW